MEFANKEYLLLLLLIVPYVLWYFRYRRNSEPTMRMSDTFAYRHAPRNWRVRMVHLPMWLRCLAFALTVIVLAEDVAPCRMEAAKDVATEFINSRPGDNIGLTIFAGEAFTQCPMTTDHASLLNLLQGVRTDLAANGLIQDGTAIGMGLANAVNRLKDIKAKSKVVILLTDGSNNMGDISPLTAAAIAKKFGIRVYTIGLGTDGMVRYPISINGQNQYIQAKGEIDYKTLEGIASATDGTFYRAQSRGELSKIYQDIDKLEKTKIDSKSNRRRYEAYFPFALAALLSLLLEIWLRTTVLRRIP